MTITWRLGRARRTWSRNWNHMRHADGGGLLLSKTSPAINSASTWRSMTVCTSQRRK
jgi:hypothetical protein